MPWAIPAHGKRRISAGWWAGPGLPFVVRAVPVVITEAADRYIVDLAQYKVVQCIVDFAFVMELEKDNERVTIRLEGPFTLRRADKTDELDPEHRPGELGPAIELLRKSVREAIVQKAGELDMMFDDGTALRAPSDLKYEAWTLTVTDGPVIVSGPGGKVTLFSAPAKSTDS